MSIGLEKIIVNTKKLNNIGRWANEFLHMRSSVSEHSFAVCQIAQLLGLIEESAGFVIDWKRLYRKALNHDLPEALVGDVISTTKNINKDIKEALDIVERELVETELIAYLDDNFKDEYRIAIFDGKDDSLEGKILTAADNIDALIECIQEVKLSNNHPFLEKYKGILAKVKSIDIHSSNYFIKNILPNLTKGSDLLKESK